MTAAATVSETVSDIADIPIRGSRARNPTERERLASRLYDVLHPMMAALGLLFFALVLAQAAARNGTTLHRALLAATWVLWAVFVAEYVLRLVIAPHTLTFVRRTWWQLLVLAVPVLSIARAFLILRVARPTRVLLAAVRGSRSAARTLTGRIGWLALVTTIVVFTCANLLYELGDVRPYGRALHASAKAAIAAEAIPGRSGVVQLLDVVVGVYSIVVFATLAGTVGAYFLEKRIGTPPRQAARKSNSRLAERRP